MQDLDAQNPDFFEEVMTSKGFEYFTFRYIVRGTRYESALVSLVFQVLESFLACLHHFIGVPHIPL
jgi:hypothetical protein